MKEKGFETVIFEDPFVKFDKSNRTVGDLINFIKDRMSARAGAETIVFGNSLGGYISLALASDPSFNIKQAIVSGCPGAGENVTLGLGVSRILSLDYAHRISKELFYDQSRIDIETIENTFKNIANRQCFMMGISILRSLQTISVGALVEKLSVDAHLIWGEHDRVTPIDPWHDLARSNPHMHLHSVPGTGHCPMLESPLAFNEVLDEVLYVADHGKEPEQALPN